MYQYKSKYIVQFRLTALVLRAFSIFQAHKRTNMHKYTHIHSSPLYVTLQAYLQADTQWASVFCAFRCSEEERREKDNKDGRAVEDSHTS